MPGTGKPDRMVLNLPRYATYFFTVITNEITHSASQLYLREFGIGIFEWRTMAMLALEPRITANRIIQVIGFDKASVSRATTALKAKGFLKISTDAKDQRRRTLELTASGYQLYSKMLSLVIERDRLLLSKLTPAEIDTLLELLAKVKEALPLVVNFDPVQKQKRKAKSRIPKHKQQAGNQF